VDFDRRRAQNGESSYKAGTLFEPKNGVEVLLLAAYFDDKLMELTKRLLGSEGNYPVWQVVVNVVTKQ
jgi:hypothetical protein